MLKTRWQKISLTLLIVSGALAAISTKAIFPEYDNIIVAFSYISLIGTFILSQLKGRSYIMQQILTAGKCLCICTITGFIAACAMAAIFSPLSSTMNKIYVILSTIGVALAYICLTPHLISRKLAMLRAKHSPPVRHSNILTNRINTNLWRT